MGNAARAHTMINRSIGVSIGVGSDGSRSVMLVLGNSVDGKYITETVPISQEGVLWLIESLKSASELSKKFPVNDELTDLVFKYFVHADKKEGQCGGTWEEVKDD